MKKFKTLFKKYIYRFNFTFLRFRFRNLKILTIAQTISLVESKKSLVRFGDGEIALICNDGPLFQSYDQGLAIELAKILSEKCNDNLVVCLPDVFRNLGAYNGGFASYWRAHLFRFRNLYYHIIESRNTFGNSFISRPFECFLDGEEHTYVFGWFKELVANKKILIVEGSATGFGVENDLLDNAKSIKRIHAPNRNAYSKKSAILEAIYNQMDVDLIIISLGPTAKVLVQDLSKNSKWALDLGHLDIEYEWFLSGKKIRSEVKQKNVNELRVSGNRKVGGRNFGELVADFSDH